MPSVEEWEGGWAEVEKEGDFSHQVKTYELRHQRPKPGLEVGALCLSTSNLLKTGLRKEIRMNSNREPKIIGVTGGKGGTGKTTIAVNLAFYFSNAGKKVLLADCDVDAPSIAAVLGVEMKNGEEVEQFLPFFDMERCISCGECSRACRMHAILHVPDKTPILFPELCLGCRACAIVCQMNAILEGRKVVGWIYEAKSYGIDLLIGELKLNERESEAVIKELKDRAIRFSRERGYDLIIIDTAPGAHCDVALSIKDSDLVLAVTEPTPFGIHDLDLILRLANSLKLKHAVVVNRADLPGDHQLLREICDKNSSRFIGEVPVDDKVVQSHITSRPLLLDHPNSPAAKSIINLAKEIEEEFSL